MEALIIDGIYRDLFRGKLDQKHQCFRVEASAPRDIQTSQIPDFLRVFDQWDNQLERLDLTLAEQINQLQEAASMALIHQQQRQAGN